MRVFYWNCVHVYVYLLGHTNKCTLFCCYLVESFHPIHKL